MTELETVLVGLKKLRKNNDSDTEAAHTEADKLLTKTILALAKTGSDKQKELSEKIVTEFTNLNKWYS